MNSLSFALLLAALWGGELLLLADTEKRLRCYFYSAWEYTQARLLEKRTHPLIRFLLPQALWVSGFFPQDRRRLLWIRWCGMLLVPVSLGCFFLLSPAWGCGAGAALSALSWAVYLIQRRTRARGTDQKLHERFNAYAPFGTAQTALIRREQRKTRLTPLGRFLIPPDERGKTDAGNTLFDPALRERLSRI